MVAQEHDLIQPPLAPISPHGGWVGAGWGLDGG